MISQEKKCRILSPEKRLKELGGTPGSLPCGEVNSAGHTQLRLWIQTRSTKPRSRQVFLRQGDRPACGGKGATSFLGRGRVGAAAQGTEHIASPCIRSGYVLAVAGAGERHCDIGYASRVYRGPYSALEAGSPSPQATSRRQQHFELGDLRGPNIFSWP